MPGICDHGVALNQPDGRTKRCSDANCPSGYACNKKFDQSYCCPTPDLICSQPPNEGLFCLMAQPRRYFYYHQATAECRSFIYSGCSENPLSDQNRFDSQVQCENFCHRLSICPQGEPLRKVDGLFVTCTDRSECPNNYSCLSTFRGNYCCQDPGVV